METKVTSSQFSLSAHDFLKGFIMAIGTPVLLALQELIPNWHIGAPGSSSDILVKAALSAGVAYLLKNFFDAPKIIIDDKKTVESVKNGEATVVVK